MQPHKSQALYQMFLLTEENCDYSHMQIISIQVLEIE